MGAMSSSAFKLSIVAALLSLVTFTASPHEGNTDAYGCHADKKAGTMHCHDPASPDKELAWPPVKKSRSDICHDRDSQWYDQTIHFQPFNTMKECLESGGRLPKS
jgi:hypothetical protein